MDTLPPDPHAITTLEQLEAIYGPVREVAAKKVTPKLDQAARRFIAAAPFCLLATSGPNGSHCTPRGDAPGFVMALDDHTLALPDRRGNNRLDGLRDIIDDPRVALLFLIPGVGETLRVNGIARITTDPALRERCIVQDKTPATVLLVAVREVYMQCPKALVRSKLWGGQPRPAGVPTAGELLAAHTGGMVEAKSYDAAAPERIRETIY